MPIGDEFRAAVAALDANSPQYVPQFIDAWLTHGRAAHASDLHLEPTANGVRLRWRIDGVLVPVATAPAALAPNLVARLKVLAELLTYKTDLPQEGRLRLQTEGEMRLSTFPTVFGEKAVVRLFAPPGRLLRLADLGFPRDILDALDSQLDETAGAILFSGPAGSGKTTAAYACLRELASRTGGARSLVSIEDPVEAVVEGVSQSQVKPASGFDLNVGLRSLLRQDPDVILVGEIRDPATAEGALQASLTGHLVLSTFHAGSVVEVVGRLLDMGIEPYMVRSGIRAVVGLRLARRLCDCARWSEDPADRLGLNVPHCRVAAGCAACGQCGCRDRLLLAELLPPMAGELGRAILERSDTKVLEAAAAAAGMTTRWQRAYEAVAAGLVSPAEVRRILGAPHRALGAAAKHG